MHNSLNAFTLFTFCYYLWSILRWEKNIYNVKFLPKSKPKSSQIQWHTRQTKLLILRMAVSQKKKATVNQIPNAAVVLVVSFALLANLSILSKWHLRRIFYFFFSTLEMYLVLPQNRSSVPEIWPLNTKVISYWLVTYCIFPIYEFNHYTVRVRYFS